MRRPIQVRSDSELCCQCDRAISRKSLLATVNGCLLNDKVDCCLWRSAGQSLHSTTAAVLPCVWAEMNAADECFAVSGEDGVLQQTPDLIPVSQRLSGRRRQPDRRPDDRTQSASLTTHISHQSPSKSIAFVIAIFATAAMFLKRFDQVSRIR